MVKSVFWGIGLLLIVVAAIMSVSDSRRAAAVQDWPSTPGRILESRVDVTEVTRRGAMPANRYVPHVSYEYEVAGQLFVNDDLRAGAPEPEIEQQPVEETLSSFPVGSEMPVYYDPANPARSVLLLESGTSAWWLLGAAGLLLIGYGWYAGRSRQAPRSSGGRHEMRSTIRSVVAVFGVIALLGLLLATPADAQPDIHEQLRTAVVYGKSDEAKRLLALGANPNSQDANGITALMWAGEHNRADIARLLMEHGADPGIKDKGGRDAASYARYYPAVQNIITGDRGPSQQTGTTSTAASPPPRPAQRTQPRSATSSPAPAQARKPAATPSPGSPNYCRAMYTRTASLCGSSASCKISAADKWSTCQKTGRWP